MKLLRHRWGRHFGGDTNKTRLWVCQRCHILGRLMGSPTWYLVWTTVIVVGVTTIWPFAVWTTANPGCIPPETRPDPQPRRCGT